MANQPQSVDPERTPPESGLFTAPPREERHFPLPAVTIAGGVVLLLVLVSLLMGRKQSAKAGAPDTLRPEAAYASNLAMGQVAMSESTSYAGGKSTFLDGHVTNTGTATVTGITVQVLFAPESGGAPQLETVPLNLVRTRQPYIDVQPVSAAPLAPKTGGDFRLIFEGIRPEWNQQTPVIRIVDVATR